jgi:hypothetical protein
MGVSSPAKAGDPVNTGVGDYWMPAFAGHDSHALAIFAAHHMMYIIQNEPAAASAK